MKFSESFLNSIKNVDGFVLKNNLHPVVIKILKFIVPLKILEIEKMVSEYLQQM